MSMRRREFIAGLGSAAAWPTVVHAQRVATPVIGVVSPRAPDRAGDVVAGIRRGLAEIGFVEGRNLAVEYRWAEDHLERLPALIDDLVRRQVAVIITAGSTEAARAAKAATKSIPIVFLIGSDPVEVGMVASLNRPGGNLTGVAIAEAGGLMSYGTDFPSAWRQLGVYAGRVLEGKKPADLRVDRVTKMELVLNTKTAKALGLTFPTALLVRADEVIE